MFVLVLLYTYMEHVCMLDCSMKKYVLRHYHEKILQFKNMLNALCDVFVVI